MEGVSLNGHAAYPTSIQSSQIHSNRGNQADLSHLANVASTLEPCSVDVRPGHSSMSTPSDVLQKTFQNMASEIGSAASNPVLAHDDTDANDAHGTLMLSKEGRSKYLGPTAGSEWLKDV